MCRLTSRIDLFLLHVVEISSEMPPCDVILNMDWILYLALWLCVSDFLSARSAVFKLTWFSCRLKTRINLVHISCRAEWTVTSERCLGASGTSLIDYDSCDSQWLAQYSQTAVLLCPAGPRDNVSLHMLCFTELTRVSSVNTRVKCRGGSTQLLPCP